MASVHVNVRLRPIKLAFLIDPSDTAALLRAIEINTCLWGGTFNPLIPTFRRLPKHLKEFGRLNSRSLVTGYLNAFDPDYIVRLGKTTDYDLIFRDVKSLSSDEILNSLGHDASPAYGLGLFEILNELIESEFKYVRHEPANIVVPNLSNRYRLLLASVFGLLPDSIKGIYQTEFQRIIGSHEETYSITNYLEGLLSQQIFLRQITATFQLDVHRKSSWPKDACLFYLDASKPIDVIDYWNLRAVGWRVVPVAKQTFGDESSHRLIAQFVNDHHRLMQREPPVFHTTTLLRSRSVENQDFEKFATNVNRLTFEQGGESKVSVQTWYPRVWDEWGSKRDFVEVCELEAGTENHLLNDVDERINFKPLSPQFVAEFGGRGQPRYVNEINLRIASSDQLYAEVVPEGTREVRRAFGYFGGLGGVRLSRRGIVKLLRHPNSHQIFSLPKSETVFEAWLESQGWKANLSAAGLIARQMFKQIGGIWGIPILARASLIKLLQQMNEREDKTQDQGKPTKQNTLLRELSGIAKLEGYSNSKYILQQLTDSGILRVGLEVQCSTCTRRSWFSVKDILFQHLCELWGCY